MLLYKSKSVFVLYTDDSILAGPDPQELDDIVQEMKAVGLIITVEGDISDFLGVQIDIFGMVLSFANRTSNNHDCWI